VAKDGSCEISRWNFSGFIGLLVTDNLLVKTTSVAKEPATTRALKWCLCSVSCYIFKFKSSKILLYVFLPLVSRSWHYFWATGNIITCEFYICIRGPVNLLELISEKDVTRPPDTQQSYGGISCVFSSYHFTLILVSTIEMWIDL
jgi:hypothetical protein